MQLDEDLKKLVADTEGWRGEKAMVRRCEHKKKYKRHFLRLGVRGTTMFTPIPFTYNPPSCVLLSTCFITMCSPFCSFAYLHVLHLCYYALYIALHQPTTGVLQQYLKTDKHNTCVRGNNGKIVLWHSRGKITPIQY